MSKLRFVDTDPAKITRQLAGGLETAVGEALYPGDERRIFAEALAAVFVSLHSTADDIARQKMLRYARGAVLDALGERYATARIPAAPAKTILRFIKSGVALGQAVTAPAGVRVTPDGERYFRADSAVVIPPGEAAAEVGASSEEGGGRYNGIPAGAITTISDRMPLIDGVVNTTPTAGGNDGEPYTEAGDEAYRERIRIAPTSFSTAGPGEGYRYHALSADAAIVDASVGSPAPGEVEIAVLPAAGVERAQALLDKVYAACNDRRVRPLTDLVRAVYPEELPFSVDITCYVESRDAQEGIAAAADEYIAWQCGALGRDINPDQLRRLAMDAGALRLEITSPAYTPVAANAVAVLEGEPRVNFEVMA